MATILGIEEAALLAALGVGPPLPARPTSLQPVNPPATRSFAAAIQASRLLTPAQQVGWLAGVPDS